VLAAAALAGRAAPGEALAAARLEELYQLEDWGAVEAAHDLDAADLATRVGAPALLARLLGPPPAAAAAGAGGGAAGAGGGAA
jgi:ATP synthase mitochondrial F1 complex assembly factor 2